MESDKIILISYVTPKIDYSGIHSIKRNDIDMKDF